MLPRDLEAALALARRRDSRVKGRSRLRYECGNMKLRHAIEVRHESFIDPAFVKLLRRHKVALVVADTAGKWPYVEDVTADFMYLRLHGDEELYASGYSDEALDRWAARIRAWSEGGEPPDAKKILFRINEVDNGFDVGCVFLHPIAARQAGIENSILDVTGHLLGSNQHAFDLRVIHRREVGAAACCDVEARPPKQIDCCVLQAALRNSELKLHFFSP
jgi:hypothetical protein